MKLNNIDFSLMDYNDLKSLIYKYNIGKYGKNILNVNPPRQLILNEIKIFITLKLDKYKQKSPRYRNQTSTMTPTKDSQKKIFITPPDNSVKQRRNSSPSIGNYSKMSKSESHSNNKINIQGAVTNHVRDRRMSNPDTSKEISDATHIHNINKNRSNLNMKIDNELVKVNPQYEQIGMFPKVGRICAIGDLHGDLTITLHALKLGGIIEDHIMPYNLDKVKWIGGGTWVVQLGDQIDRCRPDNWVKDCIEDLSSVFEDEGSNNIIINLFNKLDTQSRAFGGRVVGLLGNHEIMNVDGDFRYVSPQEFLEYVPVKERTSKYTDDGKPMGFYHRKKLYTRGGFISNYYAAKKYSVAQIGSWVFVHGGFGHELASKYTIMELNDVVKKWLMKSTNSDEEKIFDEIFRDDDDVSPFWCRLYSEDDGEGENTESNFNELIQILNRKNRTIVPIRGMVVAHTPQFMYDKYLNSSYDNRLWRIDVGMSRAFGKHCDSGEDKYRQIQVLIIKNDNEFEVLKRPFYYRYPCEGAGETIDHANMTNASFL